MTKIDLKQALILLNKVFTAMNKNAVKVAKAKTLKKMEARERDEETEILKNRLNS